MLVPFAWQTGWLTSWASHLIIYVFVCVLFNCGEIVWLFVLSVSALLRDQVDRGNGKPECNKTWAIGNHWNTIGYQLKTIGKPSETICNKLKIIENHWNRIGKPLENHWKPLENN